MIREGGEWALESEWYVVTRLRRQNVFLLIIATVAL